MTVVENRLTAATVRVTRPLGWVVSGIGLAVLYWWIRTWRRVDALISNHVADHGPLPTSFVERSTLYADGSAAEKRLGTELDEIVGLYPWGRLPFVLGVVLFLGGWLVAQRRDRLRVAVGIAVSIALLAAPLVLLGDSVDIALEILE